MSHLETVELEVDGPLSSMIYGVRKGWQEHELRYSSSCADSSLSFCAARSGLSEPSATDHLLGVSHRNAFLALIDRYDVTHFGATAAAWLEME